MFVYLFKGGLEEGEVHFVSDSSFFVQILFVEAELIDFDMDGLNVFDGDFELNGVVYFVHFFVG